MKKYVLNIDRIYGGQTANALVLNQVDEDFPFLLPSPPPSGSLKNWIEDMQQIHSDFYPLDNEFKLEYKINEEEQQDGEEGQDKRYVVKPLSMTHAFLSVLENHLETTQMGEVDQIVRAYVVSMINSQLNDKQTLIDDTVPEDIGTELLSQYTMDFNLDLQTNFKEKGHRELYMMDDTSSMNPEEKTYVSEKTYMHSLNGKAEVAVDKDDDGNDIVKEFNSSQMNVLFPYRKFSSKSIYSRQLRVQRVNEVDDTLERSRGITLQGKVSYEKCLQAVSQVGNNIYVMSPNIDIGLDMPRIHGNGLTIVNAYLDKPYHFPHSMTLFQPGQENYECSVLKDRCLECGYQRMNMGDTCPECGSTEISRDDFIDWYEKHSRRTVVSLNETYGGNVTTMTYFGPGSYELMLGTYSPTDIVIESPDGSEETDIRLDSDTYRNIRDEKDELNEYSDFIDADGNKVKKYVFDNSIYDKPRLGQFGNVSLKFNLYDTFITGKERILKFIVPRDKNFNKLKLKFGWKKWIAPTLGKWEVSVMVNEEYAVDPELHADKDSDKYELEINDTATSDTAISISVLIHFDVDFGKRNTERQYRELLKKSGVWLTNLRVENGVSDITQLTFGSYVNEPGISKEEYAIRYNQFWEVSQYKKDLAYQTVVESSLKNMTTAGMTYANNYSSGDLYGDMFVTKSVLNSRYDMDICLDPEDENQLLAVGRDYLGMGECSNQLSLLYKEADIWISQDVNGNVVTRRKPYEENGLNYQMIEVVKNINRFESSIKHKMNVFSVVVENSNLAPDDSDTRDEALEKYKEQLRNSVTQFVRNTCEGIVPVHTQLFDVQFT